ncbi:E3 ubiquitin-protein ligase [Fusarium oxysporum f. sp. albedinis]|nr:E3 ubiquitin-protein ligase [Fusarium oxysporum f. sp. albedinis]
MEEYLTVFRLVIYSRYCSTKVTTLTVQSIYTDIFSITSPYVSINGKRETKQVKCKRCATKQHCLSFNSGFLRSSLTSPFLMLPLLGPQTTSIHCHADASGQCKL